MEMRAAEVLRTEPVTTRLTRADVALLEAAAVAMGLTRSTAMRELLLEGARRRLSIAEHRN